MAEVSASSSRGVVQELGMVSSNQVAAAPLPEAVNGF